MNQYTPDHVSPPGATILEGLELFEITRARFAKAMGCTKRVAGEIIDGKRKVTPEIASLLESMLSVPARFWLNRQREYEKHVTFCRFCEKLIEEGVLTVVIRSPKEDEEAHYDCAWRGVETKRARKSRETAALRR